MYELQPKLFERALDIAGGEERLCKELHSEPHAVRMWTDGRARAPAWALQAVIELILRDDLARAAQDRRREPRPQQP